MRAAGAYPARVAPNTAVAGMPARLRNRVRRPGGWLVIAGAAALLISVGAYLGYALTHPPADWQSPVDLAVYREAGFIARSLAPLSSPHAAVPLYHWGHRQLQFTYPPFAALAFTILTLVPFGPLWVIVTVADVAAMLATIWVTLGALGHRRRAARAGATLLLGAVLFWTEPVQRTLWLGQIEIALMALITWDLTQPGRRWWKGAGVGLAAGIKLVPLIFIPYLLLTRRFRQAAVAAGMFAVTVAAGFAVLPGDSRTWWLDGLFLRGSRTGFVGWEGNQSLLAVITRLIGSQATAQPDWLPVAAVIGVVGLIWAAVLDRHGQPVTGMLMVALTALLISPISWDHHWVWLVPGVAVIAHYAARSRGAARWALAALAAVVTAVFWAWPVNLWGESQNVVGGFGEGLIWAPPNTEPRTYFALGDRPWFAEYHWHGGQLITGNLYVLTGVALFVLLLAIAWRAAWRGPSGPAPGGSG